MVADPTVLEVVLFVLSVAVILAAVAGSFDAAPLAAAVLGTIAWLPFRAPELMPCEDFWRLTKAVVAANRVYETVQQLAEYVVAWLATRSPFERLRQSGLLRTTFQWLVA